MNVQRESGQKKAGLEWSLAVMIGVSFAVMSCSKKSDVTASASASPSATAAPAAVPHLPAPYAEVRLGLSEADLKKLFPPAEDITKCAPKLVGGDVPLPMEVPGLEKQPHAQCVRSGQIAGLTAAEAKKLVEAAVALSEGDEVDAFGALLLAAAQVRGTVRAGTVAEAALLDAAKGRVTMAHEAVLSMTAQLMDGMRSFVRPKQARRPLAAVLSDDCGDFDPERVRTYVFGGYSLGELDGAARTCVANGKCRGPYVQNERKLQVRFLRRSGALGAIGLARSSREDRKLNPDDPATFAVYTTRTKLEPAVAKLGVRIANSLKDAEDFWAGAVALLPGSESAPWGNGVVWLRDGRVVRVLVNILGDDKLGELPKVLSGVYGSSGSTQGTVTTWALPSGVTAKLDIGAAVALVVQEGGAGATPGSAQPASAASTGGR